MKTNQYITENNIIVGPIDGEYFNVSEDGISIISDEYIKSNKHSILRESEIDINEKYQCGIVDKFNCIISISNNRIDISVDPVKDDIKQYVINGYITEYSNK